MYDCPSGVGQSSINLSKRLFVCRCGEPGVVVTMFDDLGNETEDPACCVSATVRLNNGAWTCEDMSEYEKGGSLQ